MTIDDGYVLRDAVPEDAELVAQQRALMFMDMGLLSEQRSATLIAVTVPWIHGLLSRERYKGWFVECDGGVVAGGGLHLDRSVLCPAALGSDGAAISQTSTLCRVTAAEGWVAVFSKR